MYKLHHENNNTDICLSENYYPDTLRVTEVGHSTPGLGYEPRLMYRNTYVLHYVISGRGVYYGQRVDGPCAFLEIPNTLHHYKVDDLPNTPQWEQYWIMFSGATAEHELENAGFPSEPVCFPCPYIQQAFHVLRNLQIPANYVNQNDHYYMLAGLFQLFSLHSASINAKEKSNKNSKYVSTILNYIHKHYASIKFEDELADLVHLSTRYMHKIFKEEMGVAPITYLNNYRISCAKNLLIEQDLPIKIISEMLGFSTPNYFSSTFQKHCDGMSPLAYKKKYALK